jgi:transcriptional regulator with XRE-family HTH domain
VPKKEFPLLLKRARKEAGLTQEALGRRASLTGSYISMLESGRKPAPRARVISSLCKALGIPERPLQEAAALERAPDPLRRRLARMEREGGTARRTRDRLLSSTLFHVAHRAGPLGVSSAYLDLSPAQRGLLQRLLSRVRGTRDAQEAEKRTEEVLSETSNSERDLLASVLPGVLASDQKEASPTKEKRPTSGARRLPVFADAERKDVPLDHLAVDPRWWHTDAFFWRMPDDHAWPRIEAGDLLLLDPLATPRSGDMVVVARESGPEVRMLHQGEQEARLEALRSDVPPLRMKRSSLETLGVVVWMCRGLTG